MMFSSWSFRSLILIFFTGLLVLSSCSKSKLNGEGIAVTPLDCERHRIGVNTAVFEDVKSDYGSLNIPSIDLFKKLEVDVPNFGVSNSQWWFKIEVDSLICDEELFIAVENPGLDDIEFYFGENHIESMRSGSLVPLHDRVIKSNFFYFPISNGKATYYLRVKNSDQIQVPISIGSRGSHMVRQSNMDLIFGAYSGLFIVMILYNFIISFYTKDKTYLYYVLFCIAVFLNQVCILGYGSRVFWPNLLVFDQYSVFIFSSLSAPLAILFFVKFIGITRENKIVMTILGFFVLWYCFNLVASISGFFEVAGKSIEASAGALSLTQLIITIHFVRRGNRQAKFFLIAWIVFLVGVMVYVFKDFGIVPYNEITNSMMAMGTALEVILLSFALADRINVLRTEKDLSQAQTLSMIRENEKIVREQNVVLESRVQERTEELQRSNIDLSQTLSELKKAQSQLVEAEKMASLGQLTAGIAHELNNPVNFISANVTPLKRDIEDLFLLLHKYEELEAQGYTDDWMDQLKSTKAKVELDILEKEIPELLKGIKEGADRSTEIIRGLKIFSRLDQQDLKQSNINESLESALIVLQSVIRNEVAIVRDYGELPLVNCYPGKLNQVFLNIINNAVQALLKTDIPAEQRCVWLNTRIEGNEVVISIRDNGHGMKPETREQIFEPFFTTKAVGEGTGLGLSIVLGIIEDHKGKIEVNSEENTGTEFIIHLPIDL